MALLDSHEHRQPTHEFDGIVEDREKSPPLYFTVLFYGLILWGAAYIGYFLLSGWSSEIEFREKMAAYERQQEPPAGGGAPAAGGAKEGGETATVDAAGLYAANCAACHGAQGEGGIGPDLTDKAYRYGSDPAAVAESIRNGRPEGMPGFGSQFSKAEIEALASYVIDL